MQWFKVYLRLAELYPLQQLDQWRYATAIYARTIPPTTIMSFVMRWFQKNRSQRFFETQACIFILELGARLYSSLWCNAPSRYHCFCQRASGRPSHMDAGPKGHCSADAIRWACCSISIKVADKLGRGWCAAGFFHPDPSKFRHSGSWQLLPWSSPHFWPCNQADGHERRRISQLTIFVT